MPETKKATVHVVEERETGSTEIFYENIHYVLK